MKAKTVFYMMMLCLLMACQEQDPTPVAVVATDNPLPTATPQATVTAVPPTPTAEPPTATATPQPSATPTATLTRTPSPTPEPWLTIRVLSEMDELAIAEAEVQVVGEEITATATTDDDGEAVFEMLVAGTYSLTVTADGYVEMITTVVVEEGDNETSVAMIEQISVAAATVPATAAATAAATSAAVQPTTPPPAAPPQAAPPTGANLLVNPGFEAGEVGWNRRIPTTSATLTPADGHAQFVHSGAWSVLVLSGVYFQNVEGVTPGQTYRAGAWVKIWSSTGEDRTISENPGDYGARICVNINGDDDPALDSNVCSGFVQPLDVWQFIAVDAVPAGDRITVALQSFYIGPQHVAHSETYWDDVTLGGSPIVATATPPPFDPTVRPDPVPFAAAALLDSMNNARFVLEQMGGLLDRLADGSTETCLEYEGYYEQLGRSTLYHTIPAEWQNIYSEYVFAIDHGIGTNDGVYSLCQAGGGQLTEQAYGTGRQGINQSLDRLNPAIDSANSLLGG